MTIKIIVCDRCDGNGSTNESELTDYHRNEYREWKAICTQCKGSGRMMKEKTITITPFKETKNEK